MALRPGVDKRGAHGLFTDGDEKIILDKVAEEVANHKGNVWSHVISLRREDAQRLGYTDSEMWKNLIQRHIPDIAEAQKISVSNLKWYAAFHNTTHHPHVHMIVYSQNPKEGYLSSAGIDKIRSKFANDIFYDDLQSVYQEQTVNRNELKETSKNEFESIVKSINQSTYDNPALEELIRKLYVQLKNSKGKKVYGYLQPDVKKTVNNIFSELAKDDNIQLLYEKWCNLEQIKYKTYAQREKEIPELVDNKEFRSVKNMIIRTVLEMNNSSVSEYISASPSTNDSSPNNVPSNEVLTNTVFSLFVNLSRCIEDDYMDKRKSVRTYVDSKLRRMIRKKKQEVGIRMEKGMEM